MRKILLLLLLGSLLSGCKTIAQHPESTILGVSFDPPTGYPICSPKEIRERSSNRGCMVLLRNSPDPLASRALLFIPKESVDYPFPVLALFWNPKVISLLVPASVSLNEINSFFISKYGEPNTTGCFETTHYFIFIEETNDEDLNRNILFITPTNTTLSALCNPYLRQLHDQYRLRQQE